MSIEKSSTLFVVIFKTFNCFELVRSLKQDFIKSTLESFSPYADIYSSEVKFVVPKTKTEAPVSSFSEGQQH